MRKFLAGLMVFVSLIQAQTPIIRVMQSREYKTPKTWWREPLTFNLRGYLADDTTECQRQLMPQVLPYIIIILMLGEIPS